MSGFEKWWAEQREKTVVGDGGVVEMWSRAAYARAIEDAADSCERSAGLVNTAVASNTLRGQARFIRVLAPEEESDD